MKTPHAVPIGELEQTPQAPPLVTFDSEEGMIWVRASYPYPIEASRIKSARDILAWVRHLSRKGWATRAVIAEFIDVTAQIRGINTRLLK